MTDPTLDRAGDVLHPHNRLVSGVMREADDPMMQRILTAAVDAFAERGFNGTNIRDIGARGGMSSGSLYNHFASKADILSTIMLRGIMNLVSLSEQALGQAGENAVDRLDALVAVHVGLHAAHPRESIVGNAELHNLEPDARSAVVFYRDRQEDLFHATILRGIDQGVFATDVPREAARFIVVACTGVARWYRTSDESPVDALIATYQKLARSTVGQH